MSWVGAAPGAGPDGRSISSHWPLEVRRFICSCVCFDGSLLRPASYPRSGACSGAGVSRGEVKGGGGGGGGASLMVYFSRERFPEVFTLAFDSYSGSVTRYATRAPASGCGVWWAGAGASRVAARRVGVMGVALINMW